MAGIVFICAVLLRDILKFFDERYARTLHRNPDPEHVAVIMKYRRRISFFQVAASVLFCLPFVYLQIFAKGFLRNPPGADKLDYLVRMGIFTVALFTGAAVVSGLFLRFLLPNRR